MKRHTLLIKFWHIHGTPFKVTFTRSYTSPHLSHPCIEAFSEVILHLLSITHWTFHHQVSSAPQEIQCVPVSQLFFSFSFFYFSISSYNCLLNYLYSATLHQDNAAWFVTWMRKGSAATSIYLLSWSLVKPRSCMCRQTCYLTASPHIQNWL